MNASIGFFDGFDGVLVAIVYGALIAFSVLFQVVRNKFFNKKSNLDDDLSDELDVHNEDPMRLSNTNGKIRKENIINDSGISSQYS